MRAGAGELDLRDVIRDPELMMTAKREVENIPEEDPSLSLSKHRRLKSMILPAHDETFDF
jgi:hypothetical protein